MSVAEMKVKAVSQLVQIEDENSLKEVLKYLEQVNYKLQKDHIKSADKIFDEAVSQYDSILKKLAE
jgi:predicted nucleotidyltransferase